MTETKFKKPYELIAQHWEETFNKVYDEYSIRLIQEDICSLAGFLEKNKGNTQEGFIDRTKHLKLERKRWD